MPASCWNFRRIHGSLTDKSENKKDNDWSERKVFGVHLISGKVFGGGEYQCFPFFDDLFTVEEAIAEFKYVEIPDAFEIVDNVKIPIMAYEYEGVYFSKVTYAGTVTFEEYLKELFGMGDGLNLKLE